MSAPTNSRSKIKLDEGLQYAVIQFVQRPNRHIPAYVCVPHSWIRVRHSTVRTDTTEPVSIVSFPEDEDALVTERRILQNEKASERWKLFSAIVRYESHTLEDASKFIFMMMAKNDIAQEKSVMNKDFQFMATPSTSRSDPSLELNMQSKPKSSTYLNKRKITDAANNEGPMVKVPNPSKTAQIKNFVPPILVKPLSSEIANPVFSETVTVTRRNSIQSLQNSSDLLPHERNLQPSLTNHEIGIPRIDPNEPAIRVEHGSQRVTNNKLHCPPYPLMLRQLLLENVEPETFSREYDYLLQRIKDVHIKQTSIVDLSKNQKQDSDIRPVASIIIENPVGKATQPRMLVNTLPGNKNWSQDKMSPEPSNKNTSTIDGLVEYEQEATLVDNVASRSYSANQSAMAVESLMEDESEGNNFQEFDIKTFSSKNPAMQENHAFDSMLNIWINNAADLFRSMHNSVTQLRMVTNDMEKVLEKTNDQFEYFENLYDNLRKLTKRNTNEVILESQKKPDVDKTNLVDDCDMKEYITESTKNANLTVSYCDNSCTEKCENDEDEESKEDYNKGKKVRGSLCSFTLPPQYDPHDTRWTLKYKQSDPKRRIVELLPGTNVFIDAIRLAHCKRESQDYKKLARKLLEEIFTLSALSVCSLMGAKANAFTTNDSDIRPGLDRNAREAIWGFVKNYGKEKGWGPFDLQAVQSSQRSRLQEIRYKCIRDKIATQEDRHN